MPKRPAHTLTWSSGENVYHLHTPNNPPQRLALEDEAQWFSWLTTHSSFSFQGRSGRLNVLKESRSQANGYWYAYHTAAGRTHKQYLGHTPNLTFQRLEEVARSLSGKAVSTSPTPTSLQNASEDMPMLLLTRLSHPRLPPLVVTRQRLLARLDAVRNHKLTLLSASAGWGKTTLLSAWVAHSPYQVAWLSLDELDNDAMHFWVSVLAALRTCSSSIGKAALAMLRSPQPSPLTTILTTLLNDLNAQTEPIILLLDDYHLIEEQTIHDSLLFLLEHLPPHVHLMLASRIDPPLSLSRLRVRGHLLELRDTDLRFQQEEAASFLTHTMGLALEEQEVAQLANRTEGWIAGLQLAALSMQHQQNLPAFVDSFTGSHRYLLDYVQEEILSRLPIDLQTFLLHVSPLRRLTASLCQAVTTEANCQELLETIERANLFLVPLDEERRWYRMHDLFREVLLTRLQTTQPALIPILHQRAARWHATHREWQDAITHALAGNDFSYAILLMEQTAEQFWLRGEITAMYPWIMALPQRVVHEHARFVLTAALYLLNTSSSTLATQRERTHALVEHLMAQVEAALRQQDQEDALNVAEVAFLQERLLLLRLWREAIELIVRGTREQYRLVEQQMEQLEHTDDILWQMIPLSAKFLLHWTLLGEGASLIPLFQDAGQQAKQSGNHFAMLKVGQWLAGIYLRAGQLHLAHRECVAALDLIARIDGYALLAGYFAYWRACVLLQWNHLDEARNILSAMMQDAQVWQQIDLQVNGGLWLIYVEIAAGNLSRAHQVLQETQALIMSQGFARHHLLLVPVQIAYWLAIGNLPQATQWAANTAFSEKNWDNKYAWQLLALIRVLLAQKQYQSALDTLTRFSTHLDQEEDYKTTVSFLALNVVALHLTGESEHAQAILVRLLTLTEPEDDVRTFLDAGKPIWHVLQSFLNRSKNATQADSVTFRPFLLTLLAAFEQEEQKLTARTSVQESTPQPSRSAYPATDNDSPILSEPLTSQEKRVLRLLIDGYTYAEMAVILIVSRNTIKTQVSSIYRKLGVSRRVEAITLTRRLSLL